MRWSLRKLEIVIHLSQTLSVTETARILYVTQPAVSQALRDIEETTGMKFYRRQGNRLYPTPEAIALLPSIHAVFDELNRLSRRTAELRDATTGSISVVSMAPLASGLVAETITDFVAERPGVRFSVDSLTSSEIVDHVRQERADLGLTLRTAPTPGILLEPLLHTEIVAVVRRDHVLAGEAVLDPAMIADFTVAAHSARTPLGSMLRDAIGPIPTGSRPVLDVNQSTTAIALTRETDTVALTHPLNGQILDDPSIRVLRFRPSVPLSVTLVLSRAVPPSRLTALFIEAMRKRAHLAQGAYAARGLVMALA